MTASPQYSFLLLTLLSIFFISAISPNPGEDQFADFDFDALGAKVIISEEEKVKYLNETDMTVFALYYKEESNTAKSIGGLMYSLLPKLQYLAEIILIDCDKGTLPQCESNKEPAEFIFFEIYEPPLYRVNPYTKARLTHSLKPFPGNQVTNNILFNYITSNIISRGQKLNSDNIDYFLTNRHMNKVILFTDKPKTSLLFRGLSNYLYEKMLFGEVHKSQADLVAQFKITKYPTLMVYQNLDDGNVIDEPIINYYKGPENAKDIANYLMQYALKEKSYMNGDIPASQSMLSALRKITKDKLESFFSNNAKKDIIIYLDDTLENGVLEYNNLKGDVKKFLNQANGFFLFTYIDCSSSDNEVFCSAKFKIDEFPSLLLYKANEGKYSNANDRIEKGMTYLSLEYDDIQKEIESEYPPNVREGNHNILQSLISESQFRNKIPMLYLYNDQIDLGIQLLSRDSKYSEMFDWYVFENPPMSFQAQFKGNKLPSLSIAIPQKLEKGQVQLMSYVDEITYSKVKDFIEKSFKFEPRGGENNTQNKESKSTSSIPLQQEAEFVETTDQLTKLCSKKKLCMISFMDMRVNDESKRIYEEKMKEYQAAVKENNKRPIYFGYVNATCQNEFAAKFGVDIGSLPTLVLYSQSKNVYANYIGIYKQDDIKEFISRVINGGVNFQPFQKENAKLNEIKCEEIQEVFIEEDDDDVMKEILAEQQKKRAEFEAERDLLNNDGKKPKKKKKKKKNKKKKNAQKKKKDDL